MTVFLRVAALTETDAELIALLAAARALALERASDRLEARQRLLQIELQDPPPGVVGLSDSTD